MRKTYSRDRADWTQWGREETRLKPDNTGGDSMATRLWVCPGRILTDTIFLGNTDGPAKQKGFMSS